MSWLLGSRCHDCCVADAVLSGVYPGQDDGNTAISWFVETAFFAMIGFLVAYFGVFVVLFRSIKRGK
jgi:hypothetical protein